MRGLFAALLLASACHGGQQPALSMVPQGAENSPALVAELERNAGDTAVSACRVVIATDEGVFGLSPLAPTARPWHAAIPASSRPQLVGDLAVFTQGERLRAVAADTGDVRFDIPLPQPTMVGTARFRDTLYLVTRGVGQDAAAQLTAVDSRDGAVRFARPLPFDSGAPSVFGGLLTIPLQHQSLAVLDPETGEERGRLRRFDGLLSYVQSAQGKLLFGDQQMLQLDANYSGESASVPTINLPDLPLPGWREPVPSAYAAVPATVSAYGRVAVHVAFEPEATGVPASLEVAQVYATFYSHVFAFAADGTLRWVRALPTDVVRASVDKAGLVAILADGQLLRMSSNDGALQRLASFEVQATSASLSVQGCPQDGPIIADPVALQVGLLQLLANQDSRLTPSRLYALSALETTPGPDTTRALLHLLAQPRTPPVLRDAARQAVISGSGDVEVLLEMAKRSFNFVTEQPAPPMNVLAPALARRGDARAVPVLQARLFDHATPSSQLVQIAGALTKLDPVAAKQSLSVFLRRYRADSTFAAEPEVYLALAQTYARLAGDAGMQALGAWANADTTQPVLRLALAQIGTAATPPPLPIEVAPTDVPVAVQAAPRPANQLLSAAQVRSAFAAHLPDISECLTRIGERAAEVTQVRIALIVDGDGVSTERHYLPSHAGFTSCMEQHAAKYTFPPSRAPKQVVLFTWDPRTPVEPPPEAAVSADEVPFWHPYVRNGLDLPDPVGTPFWQDQNPLFISVERTYRRTADVADQAADGGAGHGATFDRAEPTRADTQGGSASTSTSPKAAPESSPKEPARATQNPGPANEAPVPPASQTDDTGATTPWWAPTATP